MELYQLTCHEVAAKLAVKEVSAREVLASCFGRIHAVEGDVKAFLRVTREQAEAEAAAVDEKRAAGEDLPRLAGVPIGIKDVMCTRGVATTCASKILETFVPPYDAAVV